ncbi:MAG: hypothetical protein P4L42_04320 [Desulfocapsaceae bacterium]|nr:hypothetical protein [Desulfocapsaceae bacterium]
MARSSAPVTAGIPLAENSGIKDVKQLGLSGAAVGQFRALAWWPNGNIRWVLTDFQADVPAGGTNAGVSLIAGNGNFGGDNLAADSGSSITVTTGKALFTVRKTNFNILDSVVVGSKTLVQSNNPGRISADGADGVVYSSANDASSTAVIEENGPSRAVIRAVGSLKGPGGNRLMDYTMRLYFYRNASNVKADVILRNADKNSNAAAQFKNVRFVVPLSLDGVKTATFSRDKDTVSRAIPPGSTASLLQGYNKKYTIRDFETDCYTWEPPAPGVCVNNKYTYDPAFSGLEIRAGNEKINALGNMTDATQGYADISDASGSGLTLASRFMPLYWPTGFEFNENGEASVELYSHIATTILSLIWGKHDSHELMLDFHTQPKDGKTVLFALQYPLIARAQFNYYRQTKAVFGQAELVSPHEQAEFFNSIGQSAKSPSLDNFPLSALVRPWYWPMTGGGNQTDLALDDLIDFLRTGNSGFFLRGEQWTLRNGDGAVFRADNFALEQIKGAKGPFEGGRSMSMSIFDMEHAHAGSLPLYYFLTGNEEIKDACVDYGKTMMRSQISGWYKVPATPYLRGWSRKLRNLAYAFEFTCQIGNCNIPYKKELDSAINAFLDLRDKPGLKTEGRNLERGYLYWDTTLDGSERQVHSFFYTQIHFEAVWQLYRIMEDTNWNFARKHDLEDYLSGLAHFFFDEYLVAWPPDAPEGGGRFKYGWNYNYYLDDNSKNLQSKELSPYSAERAAVWLYQQTGDAKYLDQAAQLLWEITEYATERSPSELQEQAFMWTYLNKKSVPIWEYVPLEVGVNGNGSYTLSWTVPAGALEYQIKYSDKPIVEWLGFNKNTRVYQYDPGKYTAFFAARNIAENPVPGEKGTKQTLTLTRLPEEQKFVMKCLVLR